MYISVITNGYTLKYYSPILAEAKIKAIQVTIDGGPARHNKTRFTAKGEGTFDQILDGILTEQQYGLPLKVRCNVELEEEGQLQNLYQELATSGLTESNTLHISIAPVFHEGKENCTEINWIRYLDQIDQFSNNPLFHDVITNFHRIAVNFLGKSKWETKYVARGAHLGQLIFDPWRYIYPCQALVGDESHIIGRFDEQGLHYNEEYALWQNRTVRMTEQCHDCALALYCGGGCDIQGERSNGTIGCTGCEQMETICTLFLPYLYRKYIKESKCE